MPEHETTLDYCPDCGARTYEEVTEPEHVDQGGPVGYFRCCPDCNWQGEALVSRVAAPAGCGTCQAVGRLVGHDTTDDRSLAEVVADRLASSPEGEERDALSGALRRVALKAAHPSDGDRQAVLDLADQIEAGGLVPPGERDLRAALEFYADEANWLAHGPVTDAVNEDAGDRARAVLHALEQERGATAPGVHDGIPDAFWREVPCGHPSDPVAMWTLDGHPVCHCGCIVDRANGPILETPEAPGPIYACQKCGCAVVVPERPGVHNDETEADHAR